MHREKEKEEKEEDEKDDGSGEGLKIGMFLPEDKQKVRHSRQTGKSFAITGDS